MQEKHINSHLHTGNTFQSEALPELKIKGLAARMMKDNSSTLGFGVLAEPTTGHRDYFIRNGYSQGAAAIDSPVTFPSWADPPALLRLAEDAQNIQDGTVSKDVDTSSGLGADGSPDRNKRGSRRGKASNTVKPQVQRRIHAAKNPDTYKAITASIERGHETGLFFANALAAKEAFKEVLWTPPSDDKTVPQNNTDEQYWLNSLVEAFADTSEVTTREKSLFENTRWDPATVEKVMWGVLESAIHLHTKGFDFPIHDPDRHAEFEPEHTFKERMEALLALMRASKRACRSIMSGHKTNMYLVAPKKLKRDSQTNIEGNNRRKLELEKAKALRQQSTTASSGITSGKSDAFKASTKRKRGRTELGGGAEGTDAVDSSPGTKRRRQDRK